MSPLLSVCFFACSIVCWLHVHQIVKDKAVKGVSLIPTFVFMTTNAVEMVYFWQRLDMWSVAGAGSMLLSNAAWTLCVFWYIAKAYDDEIDWTLAAA
jgi:hypothetical protein